MPRPKDMTDLRNSLLDSFEQLKGDPRRAAQVKEMVNAAGKIIATIKCQLEYSLLRGEEPEIEFMGKGSGKALKPMSRHLIGN